MEKRSSLQSIFHEIERKEGYIYNYESERKFSKEESRLIVYNNPLITIHKTCLFLIKCAYIFVNYQN